MCKFITQLCDCFCDETNVETLCICLKGLCAVYMLHMFGQTEATKCLSRPGGCIVYLVKVYVKAGKIQA